MRTPRVGAVRTFEPVLFDLVSANTRNVVKGTKVRVVQPYGCPKNGTMGMCYVEYANGTGEGSTPEFIGLVCINSLVKIKKTA